MILGVKNYRDTGAIRVVCFPGSGNELFHYCCVCIHCIEALQRCMMNQQKEQNLGLKRDKEVIKLLNLYYSKTNDIRY